MAQNMDVLERITGSVACATLLDPSSRPVAVTPMGQLLPGCGYARVPPRFLDAGAVDREMAMLLREQFAHLQEPPLPVSLLAMREALVFGQGSVVLPDRRLLFDSAREFVINGREPDGAEVLDDGTMLPRGTIGRIEGRTLLVKRPWYRNYGHWLVDLMPLIPLVARSGVAVDTVLFGDVADGSLRNAMRVLAEAFLPKARILFAGDDQPFRCHTLLFVTPVHIPAVFKHPMAMQLAADAASAVFGATPPDPPAPRVYLSRQTMGGRRLTNAGDLEDLLGKAGFRTVHPEALSIAEQIGLFSRAETIVGVKGAALANVLYCMPGTKVLVLSPADFPDAFFWDLATQRGLDYSEIFCADGMSPGAPTGRSDFAADLASVARYLSGEEAPARPHRLSDRRHRRRDRADAAH